MRFCTKCGTKITDDEAFFCGECGNKLAEVQEETSSDDLKTESKSQSVQEIMQRAKAQSESVKADSITEAINRAKEMRAAMQQNQQSETTPTTANTFVSSSAGIVLQSDAPIPSREITWLFQGWAVCIVIFLIGLALMKVSDISFIFVIGGIFGFFYIDDKHANSIKSHMHEMEETKYKFVYGVSYEDLYNKISPVLATKYGDEMRFDRREDAFLVEYKKYQVEIILQEDGTFVISFGTLYLIDRTRYKKARTATGIIAYELQKQFGIN